MDAWISEAGPRRLLHIHETGFRFDNLDLSAPGALAEVHRALVTDQARNIQIVGDITAALARGRNCLVLTRRVAHIDTLTSLLADAFSSSLCPVIRPVLATLEQLGLAVSRVAPDLEGYRPRRETVIRRVGRSRPSANTAWKGLVKRT